MKYKTFDEGKNDWEYLFNSFMIYEQSVLMYHLSSPLAGKTSLLFCDCSKFWFVSFSKLKQDEMNDKTNDNKYFVEINEFKYNIKFENSFDTIGTLYSPPIGTLKYLFCKDKQKLFDDETIKQGYCTLEAKLCSLDKSSSVDKLNEKVTTSGSLKEKSTVKTNRGILSFTIKFVSMGEVQEMTNENDSVTIHSEEYPGGKTTDKKTFTSNSTDELVIEHTLIEHTLDDTNEKDLDDTHELTFLTKFKNMKQTPKTTILEKLKFESSNCAEHIRRLTKNLESFSRHKDSVIDVQYMKSIANILNIFFSTEVINEPDSPIKSSYVSKRLELIMVTSLMEQESEKRHHDFFPNIMPCIHLFRQCAPQAASYYFSKVFKVHAMFAYHVTLNGIIDEENLIGFSEVSKSNSFDYLLRMPKDKGLNEAKEATIKFSNDFRNAKVLINGSKTRWDAYAVDTQKFNKSVFLSSM